MSEIEQNRQSTQSIEEVYRQSLDNAISRQPYSPLEAVMLQTRAGILGPLAIYGDSLGLTEKQAAFIHDFADKVADAAKREQETKLTTNPLLEIDTLFAGEINSLTKRGTTQTNQRIRDLQDARYQLRATELTIKGSINKELLQLKEKEEDASLPSIVNDVCTKQKSVMTSKSGAHTWPFNASAEGYFYTRLVGGNVRNALLSEDNHTLITDTVASAKHGTSDQAAYQELHSIPTIVEGVKFEYSTDFRSTESGWTENGITFDQDAILRIAQTPNLPPIEK